MDYQKFLQQKFDRRTEFYPMPKLADWFGDETPGFLLQSLKGDEFAWLKWSVDNSKHWADVVANILGRMGSTVAPTIKKLLGEQIDREVERGQSLNIFSFVRGSVLEIPDADKLELAIKINMEFPADATSMRDIILTLTGAGSLPGK